MGKKSYQVGKGFEDVFEMTARMRGALCIKHHTPGKWAGKRFIPLKKSSNNAYDFTVIFEGNCIFLDTKTFDKDHITRSDVNEHQIEILESIERFGTTAGYLIYFRKSQTICFCKASTLQKLWFRELDSIHARDMILLGGIDDFYIGRLFTLHLER